MNDEYEGPDETGVYGRTEPNSKVEEMGVREWGPEG